MKELMGDLLVILFYGGGMLGVGIYGNYLVRQSYGPKFNQYWVIQIIASIYIVTTLVVYWQNKEISSIRSINEMYAVAICICVLFFWLWDEIVKRL